MTLSSFYETLAMGRLQSLTPIKDQLNQQLNEIMPLLYTCLKIDLIECEDKRKFDINNIDDFIVHDVDQQLL